MLTITTTDPITVGNCSKLAGFQLGRVHRRVGGAEVDRALQDLVLPAARADGLVVQLDAGGCLRLLAPFCVHGRRKSRARAGDLLGLRDAGCSYTSPARPRARAVTANLTMQPPRWTMRLDAAGT